MKRILQITLLFINNTSFSQKPLSASELQELLFPKNSIRTYTEIFDEEAENLTISKLVFHGWEYIGHPDSKVTKNIQGRSKIMEKVRFVRLIQDTFDSFCSDTLYFDFLKAEQTTQNKKVYSVPVSRILKDRNVKNYNLLVKNVSKRHSNKRNGSISFHLPFFVHYSEVENYSFKLIEIK